MYSVGHSGINILYVVNALLEIYLWIVIIRALLSWVRPNPYNPVVRFISQLVDPITDRISRLIPTRIGMVNIAPLILILIIILFQRVLLKVLSSAGVGI